MLQETLLYVVKVKCQLRRVSIWHLFVPACLEY
uniref:Uncharacterized protein n=1 Tax=Arundo donax TaxID=35708 RepID=A0A0A9EEG3_ARUDO